MKKKLLFNIFCVKFVTFVHLHTKLLNFNRATMYEIIRGLMTTFLISMSLMLIQQVLVRIHSQRGTRDFTVPSPSL